MRTKWLFLILAVVGVMNLVSCGGVVIRREEIPCKPAAAVAASAAGKGKIHIAWDHKEPDKLAGFKVFYGPASKDYRECVEIGRSAESSPIIMKHTLVGLAAGERYYIAVIAYDKNNQKSDFSNEVSSMAE